MAAVLPQLVVMIGAARLFHVLARRLGQPGVTGEIIAGLALGPSLFGHFYPGIAASLFGGRSAAPIVVIGQIGLILLMFQIGADFSFGQLRQRRYQMATVLVASSSIIVPFIAGFGFGRVSAAQLAPGINPLIYSLFCGVAVAITAVPILGRILREFRLTEDPVGVVAIAAAAVNDVIGWIMLACVSAYATAQFSGGFLLWRLAALAGGILVLRFALWPLIAGLMRRFPPRGEILHPTLMAAVFCLILGLGMFTNAVGIFTIFGGFAAGLLFHRHPGFTAAWHAQVGQFVLLFFLPVFFTFTGLRTNLFGLSSAADFGWLALVLGIAVLAKTVPVYVSGRLCGFDHWQSTILGTLMNTRALMELIVLNIGYDLGFVPQKAFTMLVIMAVVTTAMTGPILQFLLRRSGLPVAARITA